MTNAQEQDREKGNVVPFPSSDVHQGGFENQKSFDQIMLDVALSKAQIREANTNAAINVAVAATIVVALGSVVAMSIKSAFGSKK